MFSFRACQLWLVGGLPLLIITCAAVSVAAEAPSAPIAKSPLSPEESLKRFQLPDGLKLELVAAEPQVIDPVAVRFDESGRMWVVEMRDYPLGPPDGQPPQSRIKLLEDCDGDGRFEKATTFADELLFATGVQPWNGGVIVTLSGKVEWMQDVDGDGRADRRETWFTGFTEQNSQLRANHPRFALDNYIYISNGLQGGNIVNRRQRAGKPLSISGRDFRFEPRSGDCQAVSGTGQFGLTFDDYGNRFNCSNRNPLMHVVLADRYLARNPLLSVPAVINDVAASGEASHVYPLSQAWTTSILHAGQFTAACGVEIYRGDLLPQQYQGNSFTCEPTGNLVHREVLKPAGATFVSHPAREGVEFLASPDTWFRPVNLETGPDGALYVVDMYRCVIEHPQFVPDELKARPDLRYGDDRGRIYRIVPAHGEKPAQQKTLASLSSAELVRELGARNSWRRETAARLICERHDKSIAPALTELAKTGNDPRARVHALWALAGLEQMTDEVLRTALDDANPRVREQAVALSESRLQEAAELRQRLLNLAADDDARLRFQVALSLGAAPGEDATTALAHIALAGADDVWTRRAVATSVPEHPGRLLSAILKAQPPAGHEEGYSALVSELAQLAGARKNADEISAVVVDLANETDKKALRRQWSAVLGIAKGLRSRGGSLNALLSGKPAADEIRKLFEHAAVTAKDDAASQDLREQACAMLEYAEYPLAGPVLLGVIQGDTPQPLRLRAISALATHAATEIGPALLEQLQRQTPAVRRAILDALLANPARAAMLLDQIAAGRLRAAELDPLQAGRLLKYPDAKLRERAGQLLAAALPADRAKVLADYQSALELKADPEHGKEIFRKNCTACHRIGALGVDVAPSIADSRTKTQEQLLVDILQPSKAIDNNYVSYSIVTADGQSLVGIIAAETATSVTLKMPENKVVSLLRGEIEELRSNGISLMPDGLEREITKQDMVDLISFIKNWRYLESDLPARAGK
jgi:putative membrane-bound dehydrogenase-like protein